MYKKIYISVEWLDKPEELEKFWFLFEENNIENIWSYSMKVWKSYEWKIYDVAVLEIFLFHCYLRNKWYKKDDINILYNKSLFISNNSLYKIENKKCIKLGIKNVWFYSLRAWKLNFPFFFILKKIIEKKKWSFVRTNNLNNHIYWKWKFYSLYNLYSNRKESLGDIVIPYNIKWENIDIFRMFLKTNLSNNIVVKKDFSCAWKWVFIVDVDNYTDFQKNKFQNSIKDNWYFSQTSYILPYYDFKEEYRFYFTMDESWIKIFSFKRKLILSSLEDAINAENFRYFKNIKIKWEYIENKDYSNYKDIFDFAYKNISILWFDTWTFECWKTHDGKIIFFEVNPMSATLCFEWEDEKNMNSYYNWVFDGLLK